MPCGRRPCADLLGAVHPVQTCLVLCAVESEDGPTGSCAQALSATTVPVGSTAVGVHLTALRMGGIDALDPVSLQLEARCSRCDTPWRFTVHCTAVATRTVTVESQCAKCTQALRAEVVPRLVHEHTNVVAHVTPTGCMPVDLLPSCFGAQCSSCSSTAALRQVQVCRCSGVCWSGVPADWWCLALAQFRRSWRRGFPTSARSTVAMKGFHQKKTHNLGTFLLK